MALNRAPVTVHVGDLVLYGVRPGHRYGVAEAMQAELARLLASAEVPALLHAPVALDGLSVLPVRIGRGASAAAVGRGVARALYRAMAEPNSGTSRKAVTPWR